MREIHYLFRPFLKHKDTVSCKIADDVILAVIQNSEVEMTKVLTEFGMEMSIFSHQNVPNQQKYLIQNL